jgi:hypothetical protein
MTTETDTNELARRVENLLKSALECPGMDNLEVYDYWAIHFRALASQVFLLGLSIGWEKHADAIKSTEPEPRCLQCGRKDHSGTCDDPIR